MPRWSILLSAASLGVGLAASALGASLTEQRRELSKAATSLRVAERMAHAERTDEAVAAFDEAQQALARAADGLDDRLKRTFERTKKQLTDTHQKLTIAGIQLPALGNIPPTKPKEPPDVPSLDGRPGTVGGRISFVDHIVPILTSKCGGCHVRGNKGEVSFASYNDIVEGAPSGRYVEVGAGMESRIVDVIVSGEMPPNGNVVPPADVQRLLTWINQGARFDGDDPEKPLGQLVKAGAATSPTAEPTAAGVDALPIAKPTGDETVSFALDIAPLLVESCTDCHSAGRPRAGFSVANFQQLWSGGSSGLAIKPGKAQVSLLVQKLRGTAADGARMPQNRPAWSDEKIRLVETWINEGASFDGPSATEALARVAALVKVTRTTPEELSTEREKRAKEMWRLAIPDESASQATGAQFFAIGNLPESTLEQLAAAAERQAAEVMSYFKKDDRSLNKARVTLYAFDSRIDYSEFGTMVERRSLPSSARSHARFDMVHPYVALVVDDSAADELDRPLAMHLAALWVADQSQDRLPDWFTTGAGMAVAARLHAKDAEVRRWRGELPAAVASLTEPHAFMTGKLPPQASELLAFGFVDGLLQKPANFHRLVAATAATGDFDAACQRTFGRSTKELAELWVASQRGRR